MNAYTRIFACFLIVLALSGGLATAGELSESWESYLDQVPQDTLIRVIIRPTPVVSGLTLQRELAAQYTRRADRHREAVRTLQAAARSSQAPILAALNQLHMADQAHRIKSYWVDNLLSAEMKPEAIAQIISRPDVEKIYLFPEIRSMAPLGAPTFGKPGATMRELYLDIINAPTAWSLGYTGSGVLVANIDSGVDGEHPALGPKWRGNNGYSSAESWFDPVFGESTPHVNGTPDDGQYFHGTATMGLICGHDPAAGETTGVASDAQWISAGVLDVFGADIFEALQWLIDPDGDPNTEDDVPDVISNSWGYLNAADAIPAVECDDLFWNVIDNLEAAGAITIWAAGNEGWSGTEAVPSTIRNPANRATSEVNTFAVGMIYAKTLDTVLFPLQSSRGPSDCDGVSKKPEVVAPGWLMRSTAPGGTYIDSIGGSSFAAPLVAGAAAIMREYNPDATVDTIKKALLLSAWDLDVDPQDAGNDNNTGYGLINIEAALQLTPELTEPYLVIKDVDYTRPQPGGQADIVVTARNNGFPIANVSVELVSLDDRLTVLSDPVSLGGFNKGDEQDNSESPIQISVDATAIDGERLPVEWRFSGTGYSRTHRGAISVGEIRSDELFTHDIGNVTFTITSFGEYGLSPVNGNVFRAESEGFLHGPTAPTQSLFEMGFLVGTGPEHVSDAIRQIGDVPDNDFLNDKSGNFRVEEPGPLADQQTYAAFSDAYAENPLGLFIEQRSYAWSDTTDDDYVVLEYVIHNRSDSLLEGVRAAMFADWDFPWGGQNQSTFDKARFGPDSTSLPPDMYNLVPPMPERVGYMLNRQENLRMYRGMVSLNVEGASAYRYISNQSFLYDGFTEEEKWLFMTSGFTVLEGTVTEDGSHMITAGDWDLQPGDSAVAAFAIIGAENDFDMYAFARRARAKYLCLKGLASGSDLSLSPESISFEAEQGGDLPSAQELNISNLCGDTTWSATFGQPWLELSAQSGTTPDEIAVSVINVNLAQGTYYDTILVTIPPAEEDTARVPVTLTIQEGLADLRVFPVFQTLNVLQLSSGSDTASSWIVNDGLATLTWSAGNSSTWLTIDPVAGTIAPADSTPLVMSTNSTAPTLAPGDYEDFVVIDAGSAHNSPDTIKVNLTVSAVAAEVGNTPNPFDPYSGDGVTEISLGISMRAEVEAKIYDLAGELVGTAFAGTRDPGQTITWDGTTDDGEIVANGVYFCHLKISPLDGEEREHVLKIAVKRE